MGSSTQKNTSSGTTTGTGTSGGTNYSSSNPNVPEWAQAAPQNFMQQAGAFGQQIQQNPGMFATPTNGLLQGAYNTAGNLPNGALNFAQSNDIAGKVAGSAAPTYTAPTIDPAAQAALVKAQAAQAGPAASLLTNFDKYANPVTNELVTQNLNAYDDGAARNTAAAQAAMARSGAFGGSRAGIAQAQLASDQASGRGLLSANLRNNAFQQQAALAEADTGRQQQTSLFNAGNQQQANLANAGWANQNNQFNAANTNARAQQQAALNAQGGMFNVGTQMDQRGQALSAAGLLSGNAGAAANIANQNLASQLAVGNNQMGIDRNNALAQLQGLQAYQGLLNPSTYAPFVGQTNVGSQTGFENSYGTVNGIETSKSKQGLLGSLLQVGGQLGSAAIMASERRVKRNIELVGREADGLGVYRYNYVWDATGEPVRTGVMVDEVASLRPWALGPVIDGVQTVDYSKLESA